YDRLRSLVGSYICIRDSVTGMKNAPHTDVIEGRYVARPIDETIPMEIDKKNTYYKVEKGTDINLAVHAISKAFYNSYDIAFFLSTDTDYIKVYEILKNIGKIAVVVGVKGQNVNKIRSMVDNTIILDESFFDKCKRETQSRRSVYIFECKYIYESIRLADTQTVNNLKNGH
ncbi:MAG: NYN domain-containing protein, partial [Acetatifactor sp.]|nr:NYN domain-containing protein [Acetatifactor sp.]